MGNLTREPEVREAGKTTVCNFGIAINEKWKDGDGKSRETVTFVDIQAWGKRGDVIAQYFGKGDPIHLEGKLRLESWEDKQTQQKRSKISVTLENFQFVKPGGGSADQDAGESRGRGGSRGGYGNRGGQSGGGGYAGGDNYSGGGQDHGYESDQGGGYDGPDPDDEVPF